MVDSKEGIEDIEQLKRAALLGLKEGIEGLDSENQAEIRHCRRLHFSRNSAT